MIISVIMIIVCLITILAMVIILAQRMVFLWVFLLASPIYFLDKMIELLTDKSYLPENM